MTVGTLAPKGYRPRLIEPKLDSLMQAFDCVEINGPKWCGKTWTAMTRAASMTRLDSPSDRDAARLDPSLAPLVRSPILLMSGRRSPKSGMPPARPLMHQETSAECCCSRAQRH